MKWFNASAEETLSRLEVTSDRGLSEAEAAKRLGVHGRNELAEATALPPLLLFLVQFKNPMLIILLAGAALSAAGRHWVDAVAIFAIVIANAVITFVQELSARRSLESLREMGAPKAMILRDASWQEVAVRELVPGDIVKLATGNIVGRTCACWNPISCSWTRRR